MNSSKCMLSTARRPRRAGLTLIELVVVLVVLVALAGILIPLLPNVVSRAHSSTGATNIAEVTKAIQMHEVNNLRQPDGWDSLINGTATMRDDRFTVVNVSEGERGERIRSALNAAGITHSHELQPGIVQNGSGENGPINTFSPYTGELFDLTNNGPVVTLGPAPNEVVRFNLPMPTSIDSGSGSGIQDYVAFGVGARNSAVGSSMLEAPVHFPEAGELDPTRAYARLVAIYAIPEEGPARLAAVGAVHGNHLDSLGQHLEEYYETVGGN